MSVVAPSWAVGGGGGTGYFEIVSRRVGAERALSGTAELNKLSNLSPLNFVSDGSRRNGSISVGEGGIWGANFVGVSGEELADGIADDVCVLGVLGVLGVFGVLGVPAVPGVEDLSCFRVLRGVGGVVLT